MIINQGNHKYEKTKKRQKKKNKYKN